MALASATTATRSRWGGNVVEPGLDEGTVVDMVHREHDPVVLAMRIEGVKEIWYLHAEAFNYRKTLGSEAGYTSKENLDKLVHLLAVQLPDAHRDTFIEAWLDKRPLPPRPAQPVRLLQVPLGPETRHQDVFRPHDGEGAAHVRSVGSATASAMSRSGTPRACWVWYQWKAGEAVEWSDSPPTTRTWWIRGQVALDKLHRDVLEFIGRARRTRSVVSFVPVAQRIERLATDQKVGGSNPSGHANRFHCPWEASSQGLCVLRCTTGLASTRAG